MICLVDLGAEFWRNWFATRSAVDAFDITVERLTWHRDQYERVAVCCDSPRTKRVEWFPEYKANRDEKPKEALDALRAIEQQAESWRGVPVLRCDGYEADDVIATLVEQAWLDEVHILSSDKDLYQLIAANVRLITKRGPVDESGCVEKFGVAPAQIRDYLALCGDAADNVPGCDNVGPGRARDLLNRFGSIKGILAATDEELLSVRGVGQKTLTSLRAWDPTMAVRLVSLLRDAPVNFEELWEELA